MDINNLKQLDLNSIKSNYISIFDMDDKFEILILLHEADNISSVDEYNHIVRVIEEYIEELDKISCIDIEEIMRTRFVKYYSRVIIFYNGTIYDQFTGNTEFKYGK